MSIEQVYDQHVDFVWRNLRRLGVPADAVEDAVQEVFLVVHRRLHEFEGRSQLRTWLFQIVLRVASDQRRTVRRKSAHARAEGAVVEADSVADDAIPGPDERLLQVEGARVLHELLDELDDDRRAVLVLAELEQMSGPEIAESLGLNLNTAYARLRAARRDFEQAVARFQARDTWRIR